MICCPSAVTKCPVKRTYYSIFVKECFIFGYIICCPFRMKRLAPYTVPLGPNILVEIIYVCKCKILNGTNYYKTLYTEATLALKYFQLEN